jgi:hypothetical protein
MDESIGENEVIKILISSNLQEIVALHWLVMPVLFGDLLLI